MYGWNPQLRPKRLRRFDSEENLHLRGEHFSTVCQLRERNDKLLARESFDAEYSVNDDS